MMRLLRWCLVVAAVPVSASAAAAAPAWRGSFQPSHGSVVAVMWRRPADWWCRVRYGRAPITMLQQHQQQRHREQQALAIRHGRRPFNRFFRLPPGSATHYHHDCRAINFLIAVYTHDEDRSQHVAVEQCCDHCKTLPSVGVWHSTLNELVLSLLL